MHRRGEDGETEGRRGGALAKAFRAGTSSSCCFLRTTHSQASCTAILEIMHKKENCCGPSQTTSFRKCVLAQVNASAGCCLGPEPQRSSEVVSAQPTSLHLRLFGHEVPTQLTKAPLRSAGPLLPKRMSGHCPKILFWLKAVSSDSCHCIQRNNFVGGAGCGESFNQSSAERV